MSDITQLNAYSDAASAYVLSRSWRARRSRGRVVKMVRETVEFLMANEEAEKVHGAVTQALIRESLKIGLKESNKTRNPLIILVISIILPIIIKFVMEWWKKRQEDEENFVRGTTSA